MPQNITDVVTFTDPLTAPADGDPLDANSIITNGIQGLANRTAYLKDIVEPVPMPSRSIVLAASCFAQPDSGDWVKDGFGDSSRLVQVNAGARLLLDVSKLLPTGATVTEIKCIVTASAARGLGFRMVASARRITPNFTTVATGTSVLIPTLVQDDGTATLQFLTYAPIPTIPIIAGEIIVFEIQAGNGAPNTDEVHAVRLTFDDPGPRSF